jgi:hypothetical protein
MTTTQKEKWLTPRDPDTGEELPVSVHFAARFGAWHVMRRSILVKAYANPGDAHGHARRIFEEL